MGWEHRSFFKSCGDCCDTKEKLFELLNLSKSEYFEKRTDSYLQLDAPSVGFKFRGSLLNDVGKLEYKVRKNGSSPHPENWDKFYIGQASISEDNKNLLKSMVTSCSLPISISMENFSLQKDIIHCAKHRVNINIASSSIHTELLENCPSFKSLIFEFAYFSLKRNSGEDLGEYFSINAEGNRPEILSSFINSVLQYIDIPQYKTMGYPEFIMLVSNADF